MIWTVSSDTLIEETERRLMDRLFYLPPGWGV